jgi:gluconolactonase
MHTDLHAEGWNRIVEPEASLDIVAHDLVFGEGPVWDVRAKALYFVEIIGNTIWKWTPGKGREIVMRPSGHANGMTFDREGRLVVAGWSSRTIWRFEPDGVITTIAAAWQGKKFNSPNDIVVKSDGSIWWTDSAGGLVIPGMVAGDVQRYIDYQGVYRLAPDGKAVSMVIADSAYPNGLAFSPDEKKLYVNDTQQALIRVFDVLEDGSVGPGRLFYKLEGTEVGHADGMKVDVEGHVYCTGPGGIHVIDPSGRLLCRLRIDANCTNLAFGGEDMKTLYITSFQNVYRTRVRTSGVAPW